MRFIPNIWVFFACALGRNDPILSPRGRRLFEEDEAKYLASQAAFLSPNDLSLRLFGLRPASVSHVSGRELRATSLCKSAACFCGLQTAWTSMSSGNTWFARIQLTTNRRWLVGGLRLTKGCRCLYQESTGLLVFDLFGWSQLANGPWSGTRTANRHCKMTIISASA